MHGCDGSAQKQIMLVECRRDEERGKERLAEVGDSKSCLDYGRVIYDSFPFRKETQCLACFTFPFASFSFSCLFYSGQRQCLTVYKKLLTLWSLFLFKEWAKRRKAKLWRWREICGTIHCTNHTSKSGPKEIFLSVWGSSLSQSRNQSLLKPALKFIWTKSTQQKRSINIQIKCITVLLWVFKTWLLWSH